jgi:hypothetical protein
MLSFLSNNDPKITSDADYPDLILAVKTRTTDSPGPPVR